MATRLVRNHSHWGAFLAEVEDGRIVGVRPFERDPEPSPLIEAIPAAVHSPTRIAQPMVREGWLAHGPGSGLGRGRERFVPVSWERALDLVAAELARMKRDARAERDHGRLAGLGLGRHLPRGARPGPPLSRFLRRLRRSDLELQLRRGAHLLAACARHCAGGDGPTDLVVVDRAPRAAPGAVRRRQPQEYPGHERRLRRAFDARLDARARPRRCCGRQYQPGPRRWAEASGAGMDSDPSQHRYGDDAWRSSIR